MYAERGILDIGRPTGGDYDSEFECEVASALRSLGYEIDAQVGLAGFFIDLAVRDPDCHGRYLIGLECDGAMYHSSRSARDRDRLRQQVLEDRGWRIHRIWSTDWFQRPAEELRKVVAAIENARIGATTITSPPLAPDPAVITGDHTIERHTETTASSKSGLSAIAYEQAQFPISDARPIHEVPTIELVSIVVRIVNTEGPVHQSEVARRVVELWGRAANVSANLRGRSECIDARGFPTRIDLRRRVLRQRSGGRAANSQSGEFQFIIDSTTGNAATQRDSSPRSVKSFDITMAQVRMRQLSSALLVLRIFGVTRATASASKRRNFELNRLLEMGDLEKYLDKGARAAVVATAAAKSAR